MYRYLANGDAAASSAFHFMESKDGGYIAGASCDHKGNEDFVFFKFDENGDYVWNQIVGSDWYENYSFSFHHQTFDYSPTDEDMFYAVEAHPTNTVTNIRPAVIRFDMDTESAAFIRIIDTALVYPTSLTYDPVDDACILASCISDLNLLNTASARPTLLHKFDATGNVVWQQQIIDTTNSAQPTFGALKIFDMCFLSDGNLLISGSAGVNDPALHLVKMNPQTGALIWKQRYLDSANPSSILIGYDIEELASGEILICGNYIGAAGDRDILLLRLKLGTLGEIQQGRMRILGTPNSNETAYSVAASSDGYILGGGTADIGGSGMGMTAGAPAFLMKFNSSDAVEWFSSYYLNNILDVSSSGKVFRVRSSSDGGFIASAGRYEGLATADGYLNVMIKTDSKGRIGGDLECISRNYQLYPPEPPIRKGTVGAISYPPLNLGLRQTTHIMTVPSNIVFAPTTIGATSVPVTRNDARKFTPNSVPCPTCNCK